MFSTEYRGANGAFGASVARNSAKNSAKNATGRMVVSPFFGSNFGEFLDPISERNSTPLYKHSGGYRMLIRKNCC
jgi:hypothetical protein